MHRCKITESKLFFKTQYAHSQFFLDVTVYNIFSKSSLTKAQVQIRRNERKAGFEAIETAVMTALSH